MALRRRARTRGAGASAVSATSATSTSSGTSSTPDTSGRSPRLIIVTGVSGSGRLSAMRVLEDLGFYCVDNMPVALAESVMRLATSRDPQLAGVALGIDARERLFFPQWPRVFNDLERAGFRPEVLFL
ncbi:MAG: RNase adapter RapZ, partial [Candidatus Binataceae bacterium]